MHANDNKSHRLVILRRSSSQVLLKRQEEHWGLPWIEISRWKRVAESITELTEELWSLRTICLFQPNSDPSGESYVVLETLDDEWQGPLEVMWVPRAELARQIQPCELRSLLEILQMADEFANGLRPGPFARTRWFDDLLSWAQEKLSCKELALTGRFRQLNGGPFFSLLRLETSGKAVWFKAVGDPNLHEYSVTTAISNLRPLYFPKMLGVRPDCHGWLTEEEQGVVLEEAQGPEAWLSASESLGRMQVDFLGEVESLLAAGCMDLRTTVLLSRVDSFLDTVGELMTQQASTSPLPLNRAELRQIGRQLKQACYRIEELGIPNSLGHCDANPGNIIIRDDGRCVFLDWSEAYVGFPFATFEYIRLSLLKCLPNSSPHTDSFTRSYLKEWDQVASPQSIGEALLLTRLLAPYLVALSLDRHSQSGRERDLHIAKWLRSLTRTIQTEARSLEQSGAECAR